MRPPQSEPPPGPGHGQRAGRRASELRSQKGDVVLQGVRIPGSARQREDSGQEFVVYAVESELSVRASVESTDFRFGVKSR